MGNETENADEAVRLLRNLAEGVRDSFDCVSMRDDGGDWSPEDDGFDDHAHNEPYDGGNGCFRCQAVQALSLISVPPERCKHGVWTADHCYKCAE